MPPTRLVAIFRHLPGEDKEPTAISEAVSAREPQLGVSDSPSPIIALKQISIDVGRKLHAKADFSRSFQAQ